MVDPGRPRDKHVPSVLRDHILPFDWHVQAVWALPAPCIDLPAERFSEFLDLPFWSSRPGCGLLFDTTPRQVMANPQDYPEQARRLAEADLAYPADLLYWQGRYWILDGLHRIVRQLQLGHASLPTRLHDQSVIPAIVVSQ